MSYAQNKYILDDEGNPKPVSDILVWNEWITDTKNTKVAFDFFNNGMVVNTEFTGKDYNSLNNLQPLLFETEVSDQDSTYPDFSSRHYTKEEALDWHNQVMDYFCGKRKNLPNKKK